MSIFDVALLSEILTVAHFRMAPEGLCAVHMACERSQLQALTTRKRPIAMALRKFKMLGSKPLVAVVVVGSK